MRFELTDIGLHSRRQESQVVFVHAAHVSRWVRPMGLRKIVTSRPGLIQALGQTSASVPVVPCRMAADRFDVDPVEQPVQLLGRQRDHRFLLRPDETVCLEPFDQ